MAPFEVIKKIGPTRLLVFAGKLEEVERSFIETEGLMLP
jgi:hypothetical protein